MMKKIILLYLLLFGKLGFGQTDSPFFEQIAFDWYCTEILDSFPVKKRIKVFESAFEFQPNMLHFDIPNCLGNSTNQFHADTAYLHNQWSIDSDRLNLDFSGLDKRQFQIKKYGKGRYPKLRISPPYLENGNGEQVFVNIYETYSERKKVIYHLRLDRTGEIQNWCRSKLNVMVFKKKVINICVTDWLLIYL